MGITHFDVTENLTPMYLIQSEISVRFLEILQRRLQNLKRLHGQIHEGCIIVVAFLLR